MRIARALAVGGLAVAASALPITSASAATASTASPPTAQSWDQAGPYPDKPTCDRWRDYYGTFYDTDPCYRGSTNPNNWYFLYCCI